MSDFEIGMRTAALRDGSIALSKVLSEIPDHKDISVICEHCSSVMLILGRREKEILSLLGEGSVKRGYFECTNQDCKSHKFPKDELLDISKTSFSPGVRRLMAKVGCDDAFQKGSLDIKEFSGIHVDAKDIERISENIGRQIQHWDTKNQEELLQKNPPAMPNKEIPIIYIECDGTGVPATTKEVKGRKGKQSDGTSKTREAKLGCVFTQTSLDKEGDPVRDNNSTTYIGAIETSEEFGKRLCAEAIKRGLWQADTVAFIGDGAKWIWNLATEHFFGAIQIVDLYHAKEHLHKLIRLFFNDEQKQIEFYEKWVQLLENGEIETLVEEATVLNLKNGEIKNQIDTEINYFNENAKRMRYSSFREKGLFVGSGVIEAGCKTVIGKRLKQSGMRWSVGGANSIIGLRCAVYSNKFDDYWKSRVAI